MTVTSSQIPDLQRRKLERRFTLIDTNGDGAIRHDDCVRMMERLCAAFGETLESPKGGALAAAYDRMFATLIAELDNDADGAISRDEFVTGMFTVVGDPAGFDATLRGAAEAVMSLADTDGNGTLGPAEYARLVGAFGVGSDEAAEAFARLDRDGNGQLQLREIIEAEKEFFTSTDPDAPGNYFFGRF
ncbi:EF-hand domain-containing protein [Stackebrandtia nassauensis]|uniref:Putative signal transduction protein with EFhand domain n=1 Tax=Stackebrandtia nassauensis (strain DSM 44728 / CIP 108903 / NRRL B-16338 / NBRC 102104 / LLR-40K-21) TaxID=446470 RepID=D3PUE6_STANL|nr:EF-hand domain-containing protein [Stackebrandtia nassauensis]ADD42959.1 putative signal transduction protein with EFhand domain [Stackebrandtia nassauensis DSM 44728]